MVRGMDFTRRRGYEKTLLLGSTKPARCGGVSMNFFLPPLSIENEGN